DITLGPAERRPDHPDGVLMPTIERDLGWRKRQLLILLVLLSAMGALCALMQPLSASGAQVTGIDVELLGWEIIGLEEGDQANGPNDYFIGARICAQGSTATDVRVFLDLRGSTAVSV